MSRKSGYYVCRNGEMLSVAYWDSSYEQWHITGSEYSYKDKDFSQIGTKPIDLNQIVREESMLSNPILGNTTYCNTCGVELEKCICSFHI